MPLAKAGELVGTFERPGDPRTMMLLKYMPEGASPVFASAPARRPRPLPHRVAEQFVGGRALKQTYAAANATAYSTSLRFGTAAPCEPV